MPRKVLMSSAALRAFEQAKDWLLQPGSGPKGAQKWRAMQQIRRRLRGNPYLGPQDLSQPSHRIIVTAGYRFIYRISADTGDSRTAGDVEIVQILGPGQEIGWP